MFQPIAAFTAKPLGIFVGEIKATLTRLPPLSALGQMDARTQADVWGLWYVFLLTWPLLHQILIDRQVPRGRVESSCAAGSTERDFVYWYSIQ
jgi:hypothetical protein